MKPALKFLAFALLAGVLVYVSCKKDYRGVKQLAPNPNECNSNRPIINAQLIPVGQLSQARTAIAVASSGNKILFAGGDIAPGNHTSRVDIYDLTTNTWSVAELSEARNGIAAVAAENKIFFGGGESFDGTWPVDLVDIYDVSSNTWSVSHLSTAGHSIVAAAVGNKVLFAGGDGGFTGRNRESRVDIYNLTSNSWTTTSLSEIKRGWHAAVTLNNKIYFAGGETWPSEILNSPPGTLFDWTLFKWESSNKIDIYDNATNTWSVSYLESGKMGFTGIAAGNKIYWSGGQTGKFPGLSITCTVEIKDVNTGSNTVQNMFSPARWYTGQSAVLKDNKIILYRPFHGPDANKFDIYDIVTNTWSIGLLPHAIPEGASIISVNNTIYIAGGSLDGSYRTNLSNQVWKLEF